jgi:integrase
MPSTKDLATTTKSAEITANLARYAEKRRGAYAPNTDRAQTGDVLAFTGWCLEKGLQALPASPETVAAFVEAMAASKAPATVRRYVSSVATYHRAAGVVNPCDTEDVKLALRRMHRQLGRAQRQAAPLSDRLVERMLLAGGAGLRALRDKALLTVAYTTMCRRSELVALIREDLSVEADGLGTVVIRRSKTDQEGQGAIAPITQDAMAHLQAWLREAEITDGAMFRAVLKGGRLGGPLGAGEVARIFKAMARAGGLSTDEAARVSGHSTRVGAAQDMLRYGEQLPAIMQAGRWKTAEMVARYTAKQGARQSAAVRIAHRRVRF